MRYVGVPGMNRPAKNLAEAGAGSIRLGCRVAAVRHDRDGLWRTVDVAGRTVSIADAVVLTVPPAQALELLDDSDGARESEFVPASPVATDDAYHRSLLEARSVLAAAEIDPCWAVMAVFDPAFDPGWDAAFARAHRWRYARPRNRAADGFSWNAEIRLGLCGDWCAGGRVEGAYLSGRSMAQAIAHSW